MKDFVRIAAAVPVVKPGRMAENVAAIRTLLDEAHGKGVGLVAFPELALTGATCADDFFQPEFAHEAEQSLSLLAQYSANVPSTAFVVGLPVYLSDRLFNCAAVVSNGKILGIVPKRVVSEVGADADGRYFSSSHEGLPSCVDYAGQKQIPFGCDLLFKAGCLKVSVETGMLCEAVPVASEANVHVCISASGETVSSGDLRRRTVIQRSLQLLSGYVFAGAGAGESSTDLVFAGATHIAEMGEMIQEGELFSRKGVLTLADIDLGYVSYRRMRSCAYRGTPKSVSRTVEFCASEFCHGGELHRRLDPNPFVPSAAAEMDALARRALSIQSSALATRLAAIGCKCAVIGISGGLDSTLALIVAVKAFEILGLSRTGIRCYTLPGFGTTGRTRGNAHLLCEKLGVSLEEVDISSVAMRHLGDLGHDGASKDITYENAQARARTYFLMDKANQLGGILVGTGDLSELALGWCTFNGDHMSMYGVNAGVPKTLVRAIVKWCAGEFPEASATLEDILATPVSPELLPAADDGTILQETEEKIGPYDLHDFFIYHHLNRGASREKIAFLAEIVFAGKYARETISKWLGVFFKRFRSQQFKRNCMPDGPKVVETGLSPRGDFRMPSDIG